MRRWLPIRGLAIAAWTAALLAPQPTADEPSVRLIVAEGEDAEEARALLGEALLLVAARGAASLPPAAGAADRVEAAFALKGGNPGELGVFLAQHAAPGRPDGLLAVFLPRVTAPGSVADDTLGDLVGLGLNPVTAAAVVPELPRRFTPTALLSTSALRRLPEGERARAVAHELLHALGHSHGGPPGDLMRPQPLRRAPRG